MMPKEDNSCAFSRVTGEQPMVPRVVVQRWTSSEVIKELNNLPFAYKPTRSRHIPAHLPKNLWTCEQAWLRLEWVKPAVTSNQSTKLTVEKADQGTSQQATTVTEPTMRNAKKVAVEILKDRSRKIKLFLFIPTRDSVSYTHLTLPTTPYV